MKITLRLDFILSIIFNIKQSIDLFYLDIRPG